MVNIMDDHGKSSINGDNVGKTMKFAPFPSRPPVITINI